MKIGVHHFVSRDDVRHDMCIIEVNDHEDVLSFHVFEQEEAGVCWQGGYAYEDNTGKLKFGKKYE